MITYDVTSIRGYHTVFVKFEAIHLYGLCLYYKGHYKAVSQS